jgi:hypothetical protein
LAYTDLKKGSKNGVFRGGSKKGQKMGFLHYSQVKLGFEDPKRVKK